MSVKCGLCGNTERFKASADLKLSLIVDAGGNVLTHDLEEVLSKLQLRPSICAECGGRKLVESEFISDTEWDSKINQALDQQRLVDQLDKK